MICVASSIVAVAIVVKSNVPSGYNLNPRFTEAYHNRADAKTTLGLYAAAITDYDAVIHLKPDSVEAYIMRGFVKTDLGQYTEAIADYDAAIPP